MITVDEREVPRVIDGVYVSRGKDESGKKWFVGRIEKMVFHSPKQIDVIRSCLQERDNDVRKRKI